MKKTALSILSAVALLAFVVYSQTGEKGELTLTASLGKDRVILMEPIPLKLTLENQTGSPIQIRTPLHLERIKLSIEKPNGEVVSPEQLTPTLSQVKGGTGEMPSGAKSEIKEILEFELLKWFDVAGQYRLKVTLPNGETEVASDWVTLNVDEPSGADISAFEFLKRKLPKRNLVYSAPIEIREELIQRYPQSPYADYMRYSLAQHYEGTDKAKSVELYKQLSSNFIFTEEATKRLKQVEKRLK